MYTFLSLLVVLVIRKLFVQVYYCLSFMHWDETCLESSNTIILPHIILYHTPMYSITQQYISPHKTLHDIKHYTLPLDIILYHIALHTTTQHYTPRHNTVLYHQTLTHNMYTATQQCTLPYKTVLYHTKLYPATQHCALPHNTVRHHTIL